MRISDWSSDVCSSDLNAPFRVISSARMDPDTVETELFGSEAEDGSIRVGLLEQANGGTLFLAEVADMPLTQQGKILRALTDQSCASVGGRTSSEDRRVGQACVRTVQSRCPPHQYTHHNQKRYM